MRTDLALDESGDHVSKRVVILGEKDRRLAGISHANLVADDVVDGYV